MRKQRKSKQKLVKKENPETDAEKTTPAVPDEEKPFDLGGLPNRDLKKNLGCG